MSFVSSDLKPTTLLHKNSSFRFRCRNRRPTRRLHCSGDHRFHVSNMIGRKKPVTRTGKDGEEEEEEGRIFQA